MRVFPSARRGLTTLTASLLCVTLATVAEADESDRDTAASAASMQVQLVKSRQNINNLYAQAAAESERLNGALYYLEQAKSDVAAQQDNADKAALAVVKEREAVAALTVQDLQSNNSMSALSTLFDSAGPSQLLNRSSTYDSTREGLDARIDALSASEVVYDAATNRADAALKEQQAAISESKAAKTAIESAISQAESATQNAQTARPALLRQLAEAQGLTVTEVTHRQDEIDSELDAQPGVPSVPSNPSPASPSSDEPKTADPKPEPVPTNPPKADPTPKPKPKPDPAPEPPPASSSKVDKAIAFAKAQLGEPYKWGGAGPNSWDCSGLTMRAWQAAGINLPHYAGAQYSNTKKVSVSKIARGDLLYWSEDGSAGSIYHEAMYLGNGTMIHAPRTGRNVEIVSINYWIKPDLASRVG